MNDEEKVRLGGMALGNGVLVHGPNAWACAVRTDDGEIKVAAERKRVSSDVHSPFLRGPLKLTITLRVTPVSTPAMAMVRDHLQAAWEKLAIARREQEAASAQLRAMEAQHNQALAEKRNLEAEVSHLRGSLEQLQSSASWRVTSPMRRLMAALRSEKAR